MVARRNGVTEGSDLLGLQLVDRHTGAFGEKRRTHQVRALLTGALRGGAAAGSPPDAHKQPMRLPVDRKWISPAGHRCIGWATPASAIIARNIAALGCIVVIRHPLG